MNIILASSSIYRRTMLERLGLPFECISPNIDESRQANEAPEQLAKRLALSKAMAIAKKHPDSLIIGSDQVACIDDQVIGKPMNFENAKKQLQAQSGKTVIFHTALALVCPKHDPQVQNIPTTCRYRTLSDTEIDYYLKKEQPFDTAGSAKAESLGISLMQEMSSTDPTAIIGLPLIALCDMLRQCGINPTNP